MQTQETTTTSTATNRVAALEAELAEVKAERDRIRAAYQRVLLELQLLKRRMFVAKAERVDTAQLELEFAEKLAELDKLAGLSEQSANESKERPERRPKRKPTGRRNLRLLSLGEERVELPDPVMEDLVARGEAERIGYDESSKMAYKRGGQLCLVIAKVKYRATNSRGDSEIVTAEMPPETFPRCLAAPSMLAHIAAQKHCEGMPLFRLEDRFAREGAPIDRGTMSRWLEDMGATFGATVVEAAREEAMRTAFCLATDATGVLVQPEPRADGKRQPCRRGHYFVIIADRDHIFFEYTPEETSAAVLEMFKSYSGYIQADAKSVYDILFRETDDKPPDDDSVRKEVACWSHARRKFWEATLAKSVVGREGLARVSRIFKIDEWIRKKKSPDEIKRQRNAHLRPHLEAFFEWADEQYALVKEQRGLLRSALGYVVRQEDALLRVLEDGRLKLDNNRSERALRRIAVGRKAWLFVGSDDHGMAAGHLFSLIASARLHRLDPETYLRDLTRVLGQWPKDRYLELAPKYWAATRSRLDPAELEQEIGWLTIPSPLSSE